MSEHLDFYRKFGVSPVTQDTTNWQKHLQRREALYRFLGIPALFITGKRIVEVGPGSGQNSIYLASLQPLELVLVEPNVTGRVQIQKNYNEWPGRLAAPVVVSSTLQDFIGTRCDFDLAIAELWLGRSHEGNRMLQGLQDLVKPGGIIVATATPAIGLLATSLRVLLGLRLLKESMALAERVEKLLEAFGPHLE
jgi:predicted O-methyltransferase YrrM